MSTQRPGFSSNLIYDPRPFRLGILNANQLSAQVKEIKPTPDIAGWFTNLFRQIDPTIETREYKLWKDEFPAEMEDCDHYLITGSPHSVYDGDVHPWLYTLQSFVRDVVEDPDPRSPKLIGVCFGHQMAGYQANGYKKVDRSPKGWGIGLRSFKVTNRQPWMEPFKSEVVIHYSHQDQVEALPPHGVLLGSSEFCPYEMSMICNPVTQQPKIFSFQGHVEYPRPFLRSLLDVRRERIEQANPGRLQAALESLEDRHRSDELLLTRWAINFLRADLPPVKAVPKMTVEEMEKREAKMMVESAAKAEAIARKDREQEAKERGEEYVPPLDFRKMLKAHEEHTKRKQQQQQAASAPGQPKSPARSRSSSPSPSPNPQEQGPRSSSPLPKAKKPMPKSSF